MSRARLIGPAALLLLSPLTGCSLMNLDELDARPCSSDFDCAAAQRRAGLDAALCGHCVKGLCDFQLRSEKCNAADDDCDGAIDEGLPGFSARLIGRKKPLNSVAFATASSGPSLTYVALADPARRGFIITEDGLREEPSDLRYDSAVGDATHPCPIPDAAGSSGCNFEQVALAVDGNHLVYATINTQGCGAGQARIGLASRREATSPFTVWLGKPRGVEGQVAGDLSSGVDLGADLCSGASLAKRTGASPAARSPAVASIDTAAGGEGALTVWLGARPDLEPSATNCSAPASVPVQALGVFVADGEANWLLGTDAGKPQVLGDTTSLEPAAVLALNWPKGAANYLVGFAAEDGGRRGVRLLEVAAPNRKLQVRPLAFIEAPFAERVVLASGGIAGGEPTIGVLWTSSCAESPSLQFSAVSFSELGELSPAVTLPVGPLRQAPQLLHRSTGMSTSASTGGWLVLWAERTASDLGAIKLARLADDRSEPLNVATLASGGFGHALLLPNGIDSMSLALIELDEDDKEHLEMTTGWCAVRD